MERVYKPLDLYLTKIITNGNAIANWTGSNGGKINIYVVNWKTQKSFHGCLGGVNYDSISANRASYTAAVLPFLKHN